MSASSLPPVLHPQNGLQDFIAISRYARYSPEKRRRETWAEAVGRVRDMHLAHYPDTSLAAAAQTALDAGDLTPADLADLAPVQNLGALHDAIRDAFDAVNRRQVLPSMRSLQFGGQAILTKHARVYNCAFTYLDRVDAFREAFYLLLCGCGVGFSVQRHHVDKLPPLAPVDPSKPLETWFIEDTIEGWADALDAQIRAAIEGRVIAFDYSLIRPAGAPLRTSGGKAPGPQPLFHSLKRIEHILHNAAGRRLRPIEAYDILMWIAKAVLSGGVRRSATICLFTADDEEMARAKTGDWLDKNPQRTASNNSAVIPRATATRGQFERLFQQQKEFGEPGFYFVEDPEYGANPCVEIGLHPRVTLDEPAIARLRELGHKEPLRPGQVLTGVQFCNLTTISSAEASSPAQFHQLCARAALIGTLQAGYTDFQYLSPASRLITEREALLGVSICGILDRPGLLLDPKVLRAGAAIVKTVNAIVARAIGINPAARTTCVKPEGTASLLLGTSSGIHPHHSQRYFRRVQTNIHDPIYKHFKKTNPHMTEPSIYDPNGRTEVITFPVEGPAFGIYRDDLSALRHLEYIRIVQENWVKAGRRHEKHSPGLHHNVSCTISVKDHEWPAVADFIWEHRHEFTGIALLKDTADKLYPQSPRENVSTPDDIRQWNTLAYNPVDYTTLEEDEDITDLKATVACAGGQCELA
ncbi:MAG: recombinase [Opitutaceae bacterium]|jgi:ribonucleoside-diphosphate reductase alpha chain|nr:recombinase [Opitutaceae bacterium]